MTCNVFGGTLNLAQPHGWKSHALRPGWKGIAAESWLPDDWHKQSRCEIPEWSIAIAERWLRTGKIVPALFWLCDELVMQSWVKK